MGGNQEGRRKERERRGRDKGRSGRGSWTKEIYKRRKREQAGRQNQRDRDDGKQILRYKERDNQGQRWIQTLSKTGGKNIPSNNKV